LRFSFVVDRIVHLPVPSEDVSRRGKKISKSFAPTTEHDWVFWMKCAAVPRDSRMVPKGQPKTETFAQLFRSPAIAGFVSKGATGASHRATLTVNRSLFRNAYCRKAFLYSIQLRR
jgi:hypothetical protein